LGALADKTASLLIPNNLSSIRAAPAHVNLPSIPSDRSPPPNVSSQETLTYLLVSCDVDNDGSCLISRAAALEDTPTAADGRIRREYTALESFTDQHDDSNNQSTDAVYHEPAGQHLLVDFEEVDRSFLQSETRLAQAMIELIQTSSMTMLSYHCHSASGNGGGVNCVGVSLESHVSVHTWLQLGRLALDLLSCGPHSLVPFLPLIQQLFGVPNVGSSSSLSAVHNASGDLLGCSSAEPRMVWSYKSRGFRPTRTTPTKSYW
jgi:S-adenosylmethionine/arginine decarboxylase-like enzyme